MQFLMCLLFPRNMVIWSLESKQQVGHWWQSVLPSSFDSKFSVDEASWKKTNITKKRGYIVGARADFVLTIQIIPCIIAFTFDYTIPLNSATTSHLHSLHNPPDLKCLSVKWEGACLSPFQIGASKLETIKLTLGLSGDCLCNN